MFDEGISDRGLSQYTELIAAYWSLLEDGIVELIALFFISWNRKCLQRQVAPVLITEMWHLKRVLFFDQDNVLLIIYKTYELSVSNCLSFAPLCFSHLIFISCDIVLHILFILAWKHLRIYIQCSSFFSNLSLKHSISLNPIFHTKSHMLLVQ